MIDKLIHHATNKQYQTKSSNAMDYLKHYILWTKYCEFINLILDNIDSLKCDFCHVKVFCQSNKNDYKHIVWIAENCLGYIRIMLLFINAMDAIIPHDATAYREYKCMMQSAFVLISHSMSHSVVTNDKIDHLIKLFLGTCHKFDSTFGLNDKSNPFWYRKSNFVSL